MTPLLGQKNTPSADHLQYYFSGMTFHDPPVQENTSSLYDSIVGQELLMVDWEMCFPGLTLYCPTCKAGKLQCKCTNF